MAAYFLAQCTQACTVSNDIARKKKLIMQKSQNDTRKTDSNMENAKNVPVGKKKLVIKLSITPSIYSFTFTLSCPYLEYGTIFE